MLTFTLNVGVTCLEFHFKLYFMSPYLNVEQVYQTDLPLDPNLKKKKLHEALSIDIKFNFNVNVYNCFFAINTF